MKKSILALAFVSLFIANDALAFCTWGIFPPEREYQPLDATEAFISYDDGVQTVVLQPEWQGDVTDFAIVYPTPGKPEVTAGPADLFWQLEEATNPFVFQAVAFAEEEDSVAVGTATKESVTVVEEKQIGEYQVTILTATDADDLVAWLEDNDYNYTAEDAEKMEYYVTQGGFYFIALKVDAEHFNKFPRPLPVEPDGGIGDGAVPLDVLLETSEDAEDFLVEEPDSASLTIAPGDDWWFWGQLSPIQFTFAADRAQLPMRTLKSDMPQMTFDLYTLSDTPIYLTGVDTIWSNLVDAEFLQQVPALGDYDPKAKWLLRQEVSFNPSESNEDLYLSVAPNDTFTTVTAGTQARFDPGQLDIDTGIIPGTRGQVVLTDGSGVARTFARSLTLGSVGEDVMALQRILNAEGFTVAASGPGSAGNESNYFGALTKAALIKYQNFYRSDILEPVGITSGTGYFGPSTIDFINR